MTKIEILRYAQKGIAAAINTEEEINKIMKKDSGRENAVCLKRLEKVKKDYAEIQKLIKNSHMALDILD